MTDNSKQVFAIGEAAKILGVTPQTLRVWHREGKLVPNHISAGNHRYYTLEQLNEILKIEAEKRITIGYCRVSSAKQKDDLERQVDNVRAYLCAKGYKFEIITDIGSGINYGKPGLQDLIRRIERDEIARVVVLYKDRLLRFGLELLEFVASIHGCAIEIIDNTPKDEQQELVEDLVQIITVFSCKLQGRRANKARKIIKELTDDEDN